MACIKGTKADQFTRVIQWYNSLLQSSDTIITLLLNDLSQTKQTMSIFKSGAFSKNLEVAQLATKLMTNLFIKLNENSE